jgi:hypothetical protein
LQQKPAVTTPPWTPPWTPVARVLMPVAAAGVPVVAGEQEQTQGQEQRREQQEQAFVGARGDRPRSMHAQRLQTREESAVCPRLRHHPVAMCGRQKTRNARKTTRWAMTVGTGATKTMKTESTELPQLLRPLAPPHYW